MFWLSADTDIVEATKRRFAQQAPSLKFHKFPLIWVKSDNAGIAGDALRSPRHTYETALLASRGERQIVQIKADAYSAPTDKRLHPSTKPEPMLRHFFTMLVDDHTSMLDPTCGSGASLRAAESLGASRTLGLEIDPAFAEPARRELKNARALRAATRSIV
jgi:DNA modification methylase